MIKICYIWGYTDVLWNKGNWTFGECELIQEICNTWGNTQNPWKAANWWWSQCSSSIPPQPVISIQPSGVDATTLIQPWMVEPWNPYRAGEDKEKQDKKKRLIKLIFKFKGKTYEEEKEVGDYKISVNDMKMIVDTISNINLDIKLEE